MAEVVEAWNTRTEPPEKQVMNNEDKRVQKINDDRLDIYTKRMRSGSQQIFYSGDDERDFDRYRAEGGGRTANVKMHDKPDTIRLQPPEQHYYAKLIDGEWWWVDGCDQCNGRKRNGFTYIDGCKKHGVCRTCALPPDQIEGSCWGDRDGWQCSRCRDAEHQEEKETALAAMPAEYHSYDFHDQDEITCPYCAYGFTDSWECSSYDNEECECPRCDQTFKATAVHSLTFDCDRVPQVPLNKLEAALNK